MELQTLVRQTYPLIWKRELKNGGVFCDAARRKCRGERVDAVLCAWDLARERAVLQEPLQNKVPHGLHRRPIIRPDYSLDFSSPRSAGFDGESDDGS